MVGVNESGMEMSGKQKKAFIGRKHGVAFFFLFVGVTKMEGWMMLAGSVAALHFARWNLFFPFLSFLCYDRGKKRGEEISTSGISLYDKMGKNIVAIVFGCVLEI